MLLEKMHKCGIRGVVVGVVSYLLDRQQYARDECPPVALYLMVTTGIGLGALLFYSIH